MVGINTLAERTLCNKRIFCELNPGAALDNDKTDLIYFFHLIYQPKENFPAAYITLKNAQFRCILDKDLFRLGGGLRGTKQFPQMPEMQGRGPRSSI